jgi:hypothetical protein
MESIEMYEVEIFRIDSRYPDGLKSVEIKRYSGLTLSEVESLNPRRPRYIVQITKC